MNITLNGQPVTTQAQTLAELITERSNEPTAVATAMNGAFVPVGLRANTPIADGDQIEMLSPMQGG